MTDQPANPTYNIGDILIREGGLAKIEALSMDRKNPRKLYGYRVTLRRNGEPEKEATLNLERDMRFWKLAPAGTAWEAPMQAEIAALEDEVTPKLYPEVTSENAEAVQNEALKDMLANWKARAIKAEGLCDQKNDEIAQLAQAQTNLEAISSIAAARLVEITALKADLESVRGLLALNHEAYDELNDQMLAAAERIAQLETEKADLIETRDSAASDRRADYDEDLAAWIEWQKARNKTAAPCREYKTVTAISDADLAKFDREGWLIQHMQFDGTKLNVVYFRTISAPTAPEPRKTTVAAIPGTHVIIQPVGEPVTASHTSATKAFADLMVDVADVGLRAYEAALAASPIPAIRPLIRLPSGAQS